MTPESVGPIPASLPAPSRVPHGLTHWDVAENSAREHGILRRRRRFRTPEQRCQVQWLLTQAQFDTFWDWYEAVLQAGAQAFDARVLPAGEAGVVRSVAVSWYVAQWAAPYTVEVVQGGVSGLLYRVSGELVLYGDASSTRPAAATIDASGSNSVLGYAVTTAAGITASGSNTVTGGTDVSFNSAAAITLGSLTVASVGKVAIKASAGVTLGSLTSSAAGTIA